MSADGLVQQLGADLEARGLDIVCPLQIRWYNEAIPRELGARIPERGTAGGKACSLLIANSRNIWEPFVAACGKDPELLAGTDPLDCYIEGNVAEVLHRYLEGRYNYRLFWSHVPTDELDGDSQHVAFQRMAHAAGLAYLDQVSHLCLHPKFGPWFSLRCVIILDDLPLEAEQPEPLTNPLCPSTRHYVKVAIQSAIHSTSRKASLPEVDVGAAAACLAEAAADLHALDTAAVTTPDNAASLNGARSASPEACGSSASAGTGCAGLKRHSADGVSRRASVDSCGWEGEEDSKPSMYAVRGNWRKWLAVRDAPYPGHFWRYSDEQIHYHYTADRRVLLRALARRNLVPATPDRNDQLLLPSPSITAAAQLAAAPATLVAAGGAGSA